MWSQRTAGVGLFAALLLACSPAVRLQTEVVLPSTFLTATDPPAFPASLLHVAFTTGSSSGAVPPPAPAVGPPPGAGYEVKETAKGFLVELTLHGRSHYVQLTTWLDANSNGRVDSGDAVGSLPAPVLAEDRGLFRGNLTKTPAIVLTVVP